MNGMQTLIIRGASGTGKTTLLKAIKQLLERTFCLDIDVIREMLSTMDWEHGFDDYVNSQRIAAAMLNEMDRLGYIRAVVVDTFPPVLLHSFLTDCSGGCRIVSLYCQDEELDRRLKQRGKEIVREESILTYNESVRMHDLGDLPLASKDILYIDNTDMTGETLARQIVNWL